MESYWIYLRSVNEPKELALPQFYYFLAGVKGGLDKPEAGRGRERLKRCRP